ncbi:MAG: hypothetical protein COU08_03750 [Candidatus Harrisonbacteria bacterium CG10_big_fil_rev_8_21_14_0_10_42_17]|uniref:Type 4 fimbrial biogenesis protein PilX N-terminal domain-containing protein n=1 Tax=Candidatus Harrisonbacteria bacterium CG10_big_fil_rev_8_21_14_0_10_42_17 TaxID=1974584 RepID=A0A2M6WHA2_9BACT|nr:MAG: hypothetical protein COU08_03750 [Candidatus Harrisonbacteria bacterium CG10_big_fil_rev_8_21_14_0_10_42_17]
MKLKSNIYHLKSNAGIAALMTIVIISAATLIIAFSASLLGIGELDIGYTSERGAEALSVADGCFEETLRRIRLDTGYKVDESEFVLTVENGYCTISVTSVGGRTITVQGTSDEFNKTIEAVVTIMNGNELSITSWEEKTN